MKIIFLIFILTIYVNLIYSFTLLKQYDHIVSHYSQSNSNSNSIEDNSSQSMIEESGVQSSIKLSSELKSSESSSGEWEVLIKKKDKIEYPFQINQNENLMFKLERSKIDSMQVLILITSENITLTQELITEITIQDQVDGRAITTPYGTIICFDNFALINIRNQHANTNSTNSILSIRSQPLNNPSCIEFHRKYILETQGEKNSGTTTSTHQTISSIIFIFISLIIYYF